MAPVGCSDAGASRRTRAPYKSVSTQTTAPPAPMEPPQPTLHLHIANSVHGVTIAIPCASAPSAVASSATVTASQGFALRIEPERVPDASPDASQGLAMRVEHERHMDGSLSVQYYVELVHYPQNFLARNGWYAYF
ncbi:hypothetical protein A0H81_06968 [Grifola frondosa]|uniref:Uncharacterized protein n=1 Tax=Grifola frondosa TaxID=5627 RepID=A0A1C7M781_GRIFR|nr:hypothetical protein A0H81_06968 [Grifola frondosa]